ncbi:MAG: YbdK family carboxylate-amine ligase, partial [Pseudomonadota bacterium]
MSALQQLEDGLTLGVEEEYLLICPETGDAKSNPPRGFFKACKDQLGKRVTPEFLRCQIEIATDVCETAADVRQQLVEMRGVLAETAKAFDLNLMAASTHPFAQWEDQKATRGARYAQLSRDMRGAIHRMMICGMHVHVGLKEPNLRIEVMNQMRYFLPHMLALSASSPFWDSQSMGMHAYRLSVFDGMPRTGMPETMASWAEYKRLIDT